MLKKNDEIELKISSVTSEGSGVGRHEGMAVFVPFTAEGDTVLAHIIKVKKNYAVAKAVKILTPSAARIEPDCTAFGKCGGCCYRHISYEEELHIKENRVREAMHRLGGIEIEPKPIVGGARKRYRNKAQYPITNINGKLAAGFYAAKSHRVIPAEDCLLQPELFGEILKAFLRWGDRHHLEAYSEETGAGLLRHLYIRQAQATGEVMVCIVAAGENLPHSADLCNALTANFPEIKSIILNVNKKDTNVILGEKCLTLWGRGYIEDELCSLRFALSPLSFYQVNRIQTQRLYGKAAEYASLSGDEVLLDLYCGTGTIGLTMADKAKKLIGVEIVPQAVEDAKKNAEKNGVTNSEFICADAPEAAAQLKKRGTKPDVIILDPPRKGCTPDLIETVAEMNPDRVVYVSCDPATLARDCKIFTEKGYTLREYTPFDLFPSTSHVETVALLSRTE